MKRSKHKNNPSKQWKSGVSARDPVSTEDAIKCLVGEENTGVSKGRIVVSLLIVEEASSNNDLSPQNIIALVDVIGSQKFSLQISMKLMKSLFTQSKNFPENALISAVSWICTQRLHVKIQTCFMKWIIAAYDTVEERQKFSYLYGVMFSWVEFDLLAPFACELLCKMTEKHHVVPFRVRHLLDIMSKLGARLHILALLGVFSHYRQDLVTIQAKAKSFFRSLGAFPVLIESQLSRHQTGRKKFGIKEDITEVVIHKQIKSFIQLYDATQDLNTPKGLEKLLSSPKRRILFTSGLSPLLLSQFSLWLRHSLAAEKPFVQNTLKAGRGELLILASDISEELQEGIPEVEDFVKAYLSRWNGHSHFDLLLDVIQYWKFCKFENLLEDVLLPIFKYFCSSSLSYKCSVLQCYTKLYRRWALWEVCRHETYREVAINSMNPESNHMTVFGQELRSEVPYAEVQSLATYIDCMCTVALQLHPDHPPVLLYHIMTFFEVVIHTHSMENSAPLSLPSSYIICAAILASNVAAIDQLCKLIISYKEAVDILRAKNLELVQQQLISTLNSCIMDICNTLWRCQAFKPKNSSLLFQKIIPQHISQSVSGMSESFSLYHHPAFFGLALTFLKQLQEEMELQILLNDTVIRKGYMSHLSSSGLKNIISFIQTFIKFSA